MRRKSEYQALVEKYCKKYKIKVHYKLKPPYHCMYPNQIFIPKKYSNQNLFIAFHEIAHVINGFPKKTEDDANNKAMQMLRKEGFTCKLVHKKTKGRLHSRGRTD